MKEYFIDRIICLTLVFLAGFYSIPGFTQAEQESDQTAKNWFIPSYVKSQYAGLIGLASVGVGYPYFRDKMTLELFAGYTPERAGGISVPAVSLKNIYYPMRPYTNDKYLIYYPGLGVLFSYNFGDDFFLFNTEPYPKDYYAIGTALRGALFLNSSIERKLESNYFSGAGLYLEALAGDVALLSFIQQREVGFLEMLSYGVGVKVSF